MLAAEEAGEKYGGVLLSWWGVGIGLVIVVVVVDIVSAGAQILRRTVVLSR